jgi:hypothetical protein
VAHRARFSATFDRMFRLLESDRGAVAAIVFAGVLIAVLEYVTHSLVATLRAPVALDAIVDATVIAIFTMLLLGVVLAARRAWRNKVAEELRTISDLNHHVRNALQVIRDHHLLPTEIQAQAVVDSVNRIDDTLRRLYPGQENPQPRRSRIVR